ncbi:DUF6412 domain-containing protein [Streptomyces sp. NPDC056105]
MGRTSPGRETAGRDPDARGRSRPRAPGRLLLTAA